MNFYSKLPKGPSPSTASGGIKARYFNGKNASAAPLLFTILAIFGLGYTIDYQSACLLPRCWVYAGVDVCGAAVGDGVISASQ